MIKILHYDCFAGISGDMNLAALIDLGVDKDYVINELKKLPVNGYNIEIKRDMRRGVSGTKVQVQIEQKTRSVLEINQNHSHEHRSFKQISKLIEGSQLSDYVKKTSLDIFGLLADAEGKIHNIPVNDVHFHEVGAIDSIVDIVGAAICLDFLKPDKITSSAIELGGGMVKCAHGIFPVPAPATAELLKNIPVKTGLVPFEATTPTGAAILATVVDEFKTVNNFIIEKTAYGIGHKDSPVPNVLRVQWCNEENNEKVTETCSVIDCNIDDMNPEVYGHVIELLFAAGADDVYITPVIMKKSRPGTMLSLICKPHLLEQMADLVLTHTSTLGVRTYLVERFVLDRTSVEVATSLGKVRVKKAQTGATVKNKPEFDDCVRISKDTGIPLYLVMQQVIKEI